MALSSKTVLGGVLVSDIFDRRPTGIPAIWEGERIYVLEPDWKLTEMICEDNITFNDLKKAGKEQ